MNALSLKPGICALRVVLLLAIWVGCFGVALSSGQTIRVENPDALPVVDRAKVLTSEQVASLGERLRNLADTDGTQVAVIVLPTTGDEDIFTFSQRTFEEWGVGQAKDSNGALFVVATQDRDARIHTGYGLEGSLTDALSLDILQTTVTPEFRKGDYYQGISNGVDAIIQVVRGEYTPPERTQDSDALAKWILIILVILFIIFIQYQIHKHDGGSGLGNGRKRASSMPNIWTTGGGGGFGGGSGGGFSGGFGGGFGGGSSGGGGASSGW